MKRFLGPRGIDLDISSAYNPAGIFFAENGIRRIKRVIGHEKFADAFDDIQALN